jgi:AcrR family transcriptional regulator
MVETAAETPGRDRILDEAAALFLEHGYEATSVRRIAEAVGMQAASIYHHFHSKDDLLEVILRRGLDVMTAAFSDASTATLAANGETRLAAHVRAHLAALYENGPYTATHVTTFRTAPATVRTTIVPQRDAYEALWTSLLEDLVTSGVLAPGTAVGPARLMLLGGMNASVEWFDPRRGSLDDLAHLITRQTLYGLSAPTKD